MSRRLYRSMAQARSVLNHGGQPELSAEERAQIAEESAAGIEAQRRRSEEAMRLIVHPVIEPTHGWRFRVMRRYSIRDHGDLYECIGEARTLHEAETIASKEQGAALVFEIGKVRYFNYQPTEIRA